MTRHKMNPELNALVDDSEAYLRQYVTFENPAYPFVASLWAAGTYLWPHFDAFGYLCITSGTKRAGKTRFSEVLSFLCSNARNVTGMTPAVIFRSIDEEKPSLFIDEAESFSSETLDDMMRAVLNGGYRRGQTIRRMSKDGIVEFSLYCPKVFILIGDVRDTLRDRSIVIRMQRGEPPKRFIYEPAKLEGSELGERLKTALEGQRERILTAYTSSPGLTFLPDRDEEIWLPLFALCEVLCPQRLTELERIAVDMATWKGTVEAFRVTEKTRRGDNEREATDEEYSRRLVRDLLAIIGDAKAVWTNDALPKLYELPTGPWRAFRGEGLTAVDMASMLRRQEIVPKNIRVGGRKNGQVKRGYDRETLARKVREWDDAKASQ